MNIDKLTELIQAAQCEKAGFDVYVDIETYRGEDEQLRQEIAWETKKEREALKGLREAALDAQSMISELKEVFIDTQHILFVQKDTLLPLEPPKIQLTMYAPNLARLEEVMCHLAHELVVVVDLEAPSVAEPRNDMFQSFALNKL